MVEDDVLRQVRGAKARAEARMGVDERRLGRPRHRGPLPRGHHVRAQRGQRVRDALGVAGRQTIDSGGPIIHLPHQLSPREIRQADSGGVALGFDR